MPGQSVTQAIVVDQETLNPNHGALQIALFYPDGTPFVPITSPPEEEQNTVLDGGGP